jgi:hypothetical protein
MAVTGKRVFVLAVVVACFGGCAAKGEPYAEPGTSACAPLAAAERPIELGEVIAVAEAADGTIYVADQVDADYRVFVANGAELVRAPVTGTGSLTSAGGETVLLGFLLGDVDWRLAIEISESSTRVALAQGTAERSFEDVLAAGEELGVLDESAIADLPLRNLPGDIEIEYVARVETGEGLAVIRPREDWGYEDFRLFLGGAELLVEREVESVVRARDGGSTWIRFDFHGETAELSFPVNDPATLVTGSGTYAVERLANEMIDTFSFECLD